MKEENKKLLILHLLMILLELMGLITTINVMHHIEFQYYTEDSNILMLIISLIFVYYLVSNKKIPRWLEILNHMAVLGLTVTFTVVILVLAPMYNFNYLWLLFKDAMLYFHTLCPILAIITYIFFTKTSIEKKHIPNTMTFTIIYSIILIILNICQVVEGPYPFLMVYKQPIYMSIIWIILLVGGAYLLSIVLYNIKKRINS